MKFGVLMAILLAFPLATALSFTEIMYNPEGNDYDYEYVELYAENETNLLNYSFSGIDLVFDNITVSGIFIVCNKKGMFESFFNASCLAEFGGSLSNSGETIILYDQFSSIAASASFDSLAEEGMSIHLIEGEWTPSDASPGFLTIFDDAPQALNNSEENQTNESNETSACDIKLSIDIPDKVFKSGEKIKYSHILSDDSINFNISYWIEDLEENIVRKKYLTSNLNQKSYTPNIKAREQVLVLKSYAYVSCNDSNFTNNFAQSNLIVKNLDWNESIIEEKTVTKKNAAIASFYTRTRIFEEGKELKLQGTIDDFNESEYKVIIDHNNVSKQIEVEKNKFSIPINLTGGENKFILQVKRDGELISSRFFSVEAKYNSLSVSEPLSNEADPITEEPTESVINKKKSQLNNVSEVVYESNNRKLSNIIKYIFLGLSALLNVVLIVRR